MSEPISFNHHDAFLRILDRLLEIDTSILDEDDPAAKDVSLVSSLLKAVDSGKASQEEALTLSSVVLRLSEELERTEGFSADGGYMWTAADCANWLRDQSKAFSQIAHTLSPWVCCKNNSPEAVDESTMENDADPFQCLIGWDETHDQEVLRYWWDVLSDPSLTYYRPTGLTLATSQKRSE